MKKNFIPEYFLCVTARAISLLVRILSLSFSIFVARRIGWLAYYFVIRKRNIAYKNIKTAFPEYNRKQINSIVKKVFMNSAQHIIEVAYLPWMDQKYIDKNVEFENFENVVSLLKDKKGAIFMGLHEGSWEIPCVVLGRTLKEYNYTVLAREQINTPMLNDLLNEYRQRHCCGIIKVKDNLRPLVEHLKKGYALGMVADHGAQGGVFVDFFNKPALTPTGAVKLALKFNVHLIIGYVRRNGGTRHRIVFRPYDVVKTGNADLDIKQNLENINHVFEESIRKTPDEYLWFFKRWKHSPQRNVLVLSDGKAGHLKQSLAVLDLIKQLPFTVRSDVVEVKFKQAWRKIIFNICALFFSNKCQGCMWCFFRDLDPQATKRIASNYYDVIISCGSSLAMVNKLISFENRAKSIVIMKPGMFSVKRFDLVIVPEHDNVIKLDNVVATKGAISTPADKNSDFIREIINKYNLDKSLNHPVIGLVIGGSNKYLSMELDDIKDLLNSLKGILEQNNASLLVSTSRRTSSEIEQFLEKELQGHPKCRMLIIANEDNPKGSIETIFCSSDIIIISGDSISMISEALGYGKHVFVFALKKKSQQLISKHERFVNGLVKEGYISIVTKDLKGAMLEIWNKKPPVKNLKDKDKIIAALKKII